MAVRNRMDELEEWCFWRRPHSSQGAVLPRSSESVLAPSPEFPDSLNSSVIGHRPNDNSPDLYAVERQLKNVIIEREASAPAARVEFSDLKFNAEGVDRRRTQVRRVVSSESIPSRRTVALNRSCSILSHDESLKSIKVAESHHPPVRYIQSAKGTWTYNL